ncbi:MAG: lipase family alpha/beta hydrolase [Flavobacteriales bacterium]
MKIKNLFLVFLVLFFVGCHKEDNLSDDKNPIDNSNIVTEIVSSSGGAVQVEGKFRIVIPEGALIDETEVTIGVQGNEPTSVPNPNFSVIGEPFTVRIPVDSLNKSAEIIIPIPDNFQEADNMGFYALQEGTYMPLFYQVNDLEISITLDIINFQENYASALNKKNSVLGEVIIIGLNLWQMPPPTEQLGLKIVTYNNNEFNFTEPNVLNNNGNTLLFVHGWTGNPSGTWEVAIPFFQNQGFYDQILTFGYDSKDNIDENGLDLANAIDAYLNQGMNIDIVSHSMGGLVSRSAIENHSASDYVDRLVTLGTPHQGSPFAAFRHLMGAFVLLDDLDIINSYNISNPISYNNITQGVSDMIPNSDFLNDLNSNPNAETSYYAISGYGQFGADNLLLNYVFNNEVHDGVVKETSALGISNNNSLGFPIKFPIDETGVDVHLNLMKDLSVLENVQDYLEYNSNSSTFNGNVTLTTQQEVNIFASDNYTIIDGYLFIGEQGNTNNINDLSGLSSLTSINGDGMGNGLRIENTELTSLNGLGSVNLINGGLDLVNNSSLSDISQLSNLINISNLQVYNCDGLSNLYGLHNIQTMGNVSIVQNSGLNMLTLTELTSSMNFEIMSNQNLLNISSLSNLTTVNDLWITQNGQLSDFCGLNNLISNNGISGGYTVYSNLYNPTLQNLVDGNCSQ